MVVATPVSARFRVLAGPAPDAPVAVSVGRIDRMLNRERAHQFRDALNILRTGPVSRPLLSITETLSMQQ